MDISNSIKKVDVEEKCAGSAKYTDDLTRENLHYGETLRSQIPHGKIRSIQHPQGFDDITVVDYRDIPGKNVVKIIFDDQVVFPVDTVTYLGEPILLAVGKDKARVLEFLQKTVVEYEPLEPVLDWTKSAVHYHFEKGDGDRVFAQADHVFKRTYETGYQEQAYIEPQGFLGEYDNGKVTLTGSIQCPYYVKNALIQTLGTSGDNIRVIQAAVGGAFGGKEEFPSLLASQLAVALLKVKQPIKMIYTREEDMISTTKRHPSKTVMEAAIGRNGEFLGLRAKVGIDGGANIGLSGVVLSRALIAATGAYTIDNLAVTGDVFLTNTVPNGAFRGFGAPQMLFAIEMFMGHLAKHLGVDEIRFRQQYLAKQGDHTSTSGTFRDPIIMPDMIQKAMELSDYQKKSQEYLQKRTWKGIGMSWFLHGCGFTGSGEAQHIKARVKLHKHQDSTVDILIAAVDMGQGIKTTIRKLAANILEKPIEEVRFDYPDTDKVPDSGPTVASRTMMIVGGLVARCAKRMKETWRDGDYVLEEQYVQPSYIEWDEASMNGDAYPAYSWGVNIVEVSVHPVTYEVSLTQITSVYDLGKAIDERIVMGQADGGILQGVAYGYLEVMNQKQGKIQHKNFTDYIIPTSVDAPPMRTVIMDNPYPLGPYGAKGVGELTLVGGAPAVAKAIEMAIHHEITKIPATPESLMELINHGEH